MLDQTHLGYVVAGWGDLIVHVRMQPCDTSTGSMEQGAALAYGMIKDTIDSGTFRVSDPVQIWTVRTGEAPQEWNAAALSKAEEKYHKYRAGVMDLLRKL